VGTGVMVVVDVELGDGITKPPQALSRKTRQSTTGSARECVNLSAGTKVNRLRLFPYPGKIKYRLVRFLDHASMSFHYFGDPSKKVGTLRFAQA